MGSFSIWHMIILLFVIGIPLALVFFIALIAKSLSKKPASEKNRSDSNSKAAEIAALHDLLTKGALSQEEFDREKEKLLSNQ